MSRKIYNAIFVTFSILPLIMLMGFSNAHDHLQGEWAVIPQETVQLEDNKNFVQGRKTKVESMLANTNFKFIFKENQAIHKQGNNIKSRHDYEIKHVSDNVITISMKGKARMKFIGNDEAIFDLSDTSEDGQINAFYLHKIE